MTSSTRLDPDLIDAAWNEVCTLHPRPDTTGARRRWLNRHKPLLTATYKRLAAERVS